MHTLTRRKAMAGLVAANAIIMAPSLSFGKGAGRPRFVLVLLRGALDGLAAVPAHGDAQYRAARAGLAVAAPGARHGAIDLDGFFGLHPAWAPLHALYDIGELLIVPAVGTRSIERSHITGQLALDGHASRSGPISQGWLARATALLADMEDVEAVPFQAVPVGARSRPMLPDLVADLCRGDAALELAIAAGCGGLELAAARQIQAAAFQDAAKRTGEWLSAGGARRVAMIESFGWDTHSDQGAHDGRLASALSGLADGLVALAAASGDAWRHTVVLVATEFGRSVGMNTMGGTDHGTASVALLLGGAVAGGRVIGRWPGLAQERLYRGRDLLPTMDLRAVSKAVLIEHLGLPRDAVERAVLPDCPALQPLPGLLRA